MGGKHFIFFKNHSKFITFVQSDIEKSDTNYLHLVYRTEDIHAEKSCLVTRCPLIKLTMKILELKTHIL